MLGHDKFFVLGHDKFFVLQGLCDTAAYLTVSASASGRIYTSFSMPSWNSIFSTALLGSLFAVAQEKSI